MNRIYKETTMVLYKPQMTFSPSVGLWQRRPLVSEELLSWEAESPTISFIFSYLNPWWMIRNLLVPWVSTGLSSRCLDTYHDTNWFTSSLWIIFDLAICKFHSVCSLTSAASLVLLLPGSDSGNCGSSEHILEIVIQKDVISRRNLASDSWNIPLREFLLSYVHTPQQEESFISNTVLLLGTLQL
jgi:hypothetical protein